MFLPKNVNLNELENRFLKMALNCTCPLKELFMVKYFNSFYTFLPCLLNIDNLSINSIT